MKRETTNRIGLLILLLIVGYILVASATPVVQDWWERRRIANEIDTKVKDTKLTFRKLSNCYWDEWDKSGYLKDGWGNPITYNKDEQEQNVTFRSAGIDGQMGNEDDLSQSFPIRKKWRTIIWGKK